MSYSASYTFMILTLIEDRLQKMQIAFFRNKIIINIPSYITKLMAGFYSYVTAYRDHLSAPRISTNESASQYATSIIDRAADYIRRRKEQREANPLRGLDILMRMQVKEGASHLDKIKQLESIAESNRSLSEGETKELLAHEVLYYLCQERFESRLRNAGQKKDNIYSM
jgi:hypothetical protein